MSDLDKKLILLALYAFAFSASGAARAESSSIHGVVPQAYQYGTIFETPEHDSGYTPATFFQAVALPPEVFGLFCVNEFFKRLGYTVALEPAPLYLLFNTGNDPPLV